MFQGVYGDSKSIKFLKSCPGQDFASHCFHFAWMWLHALLPDNFPTPEENTFTFLLPFLLRDEPQETTSSLKYLSSILAALYHLHSN